MEIASSPLHPELTWTRFPPALTKFSGNFLTLISVMHDRASVSPCTLVLFLQHVLVFLFLAMGLVCLCAHALTKQHPAGCEAGSRSNVPAKPQEGPRLLHLHL